MHVHLCVALWLFSLHPSLVFYFVPPFSFQPFQMFTSEFNERSRSNPLCDFRLGTVATSDHETPLTYLEGTCNNSFCEKWHPPECLFYKTKSGCRFGEKCSYAHRQVDEQPTKRSKKNDDKSAVAISKKGDWHEREHVTDQFHDRSGKLDKRSDKKLGRSSSQRRSSDARQLACVFQDMTPPKSILRKCTDMRKPIQHVKFTKAIARHTEIRDQNPSLGYICPDEPHQRSPNAPKFEDRSQEETEWQEQGAREAVWKLAKNVFKSKEHERTTFFSPSDCLHQLLNLRNENLLSTPERQCT